jgi:hypothetical protein
MHLTNFTTKKSCKCSCCGKKKKDLNLYCEELVDGTYCGKCYERILILENVKKDISELGDLMTLSICEIIDLTAEKLGYLK